MSDATTHPLTTSTPPPVAYHKIMLTVDGSPLAAQAIPQATQMARLFNAPLVVFRAVADLYERNMYQVPAGMVPQVTLYNQGLLDRWVAEVKQEQAALLEELRGTGLQVEAVIQIGDAASSILDYAERNDIDLLVMATHGRSGLARVVYGSVAERVLQHAPCPLLLVRVASDDKSVDRPSGASSAA